MGQAWLSVIILASCIINFSASENCFPSDAPGQRLLNGQKTDCIGFKQVVPGYLIYPENGLSANADPLALALVKEQLHGFELLRDRDAEEHCPTYFVLDANNIDAWVTSLNPEDVVNNLKDICFAKHAFAETSQKLFSYRMLYKVVTVTGENGAKVFKPVKVAVSTPGGSDFMFIPDNAGLAEVCTSCIAPDLGNSSSELLQSENLADVLNSLK